MIFIHIFLLYRITVTYEISYDFVVYKHNIIYYIDLTLGYTTPIKIKKSQYLLFSINIIKQKAAVLDDWMTCNLTTPTSGQDPPY